MTDKEKIITFFSDFNMKFIEYKSELYLQDNDNITINNEVIFGFDDNGKLISVTGWSG